MFCFGRRTIASLSSTETKCRPRWQESRMPSPFAFIAIPFLMGVFLFPFSGREPAKPRGQDPNDGPLAPNEHLGRSLGSVRRSGPKLCSVFVTE